MPASFFRQGILRRSWEALWSNKALWFFGLFAAILAIGEEYDLLVRNSDVLDSVPTQLANLKDVSQNGALAGLWDNIVKSLQNYLPQTLGMILTWIVIILAIAWMVIVSQAALIEGVRRHEERKPYSLLDGFDRGMANFWPMFILNVVAKVAVYGLLYIVVVPLSIAYVMNPSQSLILGIMFWTFIVLVPFITIVAFVMKFAASFIVIKRYPVRQAITAGWNMFMQNWLVTLEMAIIIILINLGVTLTATYTLFGMFNFPNTTTVGYLIIFAAFAFIFSWLTVFQYAAWTNLFFRLQEGHAPSKLRRIMHYVLGIEDRSSRTAAASTKR